MLIFIITMFHFLAFSDLVYLKGEEIYWRKGAYDKTASLYTGIAEFGLFYLMLGLALYCSTFSWIDRGIILGTTIFWHVCGIEDFLFYFYEPIIPVSDRESDANVKFWIWRFPKEMEWLEKSPILKLVCGAKIPLVRFLVFVSAIILITVRVL